MTETNLKTCPFCGGKAKCVEFYELYHVVCCDCYVAGQDCLTREDAVSAWNTRPIEDELDKKNGCLIGTCHDLHDLVEDFRAECDQKDLEIKRLREALLTIGKEFEKDEISSFHINRLIYEALKGGNNE